MDILHINIIKNKGAVRKRWLKVCSEWIKEKCQKKPKKQKKRRMFIYWKEFWKAVGNGLVNLWKWLRSCQPKWEPRFWSLAPTDKADNINIYEEALSQALFAENVYNIAVTGTYGSGKSSFLRTYFKEHPSFWPFGGKRNKVITISLAELADKSKGKVIVTRQEIELSILHQLFFHERANSLADSHFTKIQKFGGIKLLCYTFCTILFIVSCVHLIWPGVMTHLFGLPNIEFLKSHDWWHWFSVGMVVGGVAWIIHHLIRVVAQLAVRKLSVKSASIELTNRHEKSILNAHIDEIIYFFSVTGYNVVLLEDLDRFDKQSIFVKLREINHLINNSEEVKQRVRFIYAMREQMFSDNTTRTKFFDFIIPIIPHVDASNSRDVLRGALKEVPHLEGVIDIVAINVKDARLLHNIINEFYIYRRLQTKQTLEGDRQIFALVAYKNLYPQDFEDLRFNHTGILAKQLKRRKELINSRTEQINKEIDDIKAKISEARDEQLQSELELRRLLSEYILREALSQARGYTKYDRVITNTGKQLNIFHIEKEENFNQLITESSFRLGTGRNGENTESFIMRDVLNTVYGEVTYSERKKRIQNKVNIPSLQAKIRELQDERIQLKQQNLQVLLHLTQANADENNREQWNDEKDLENMQRLFIDDLLYDGYITEDYADYISFFHEGSMTQTDNAFVRSIKRHEKPYKEKSFDYPKAVVRSLEVRHFAQPEVLDVELIDALFESEGEEDKIAALLNMLKGYSKECVGFISQYVEEGKHSPVLIQKLCEDEKKLLWAAIYDSDLAENDKLVILQSIIQNGHDEDVYRNLDGMREFLESRPDYFTWPLVKEERLWNVAETLNLHFTSLVQETSQESIQFVREHNLYVLSPKMLATVLPDANREMDIFESANYTYLHYAKQENVLMYVDDNIEEYVKNVWMAIPNSTREESMFEGMLLTNDNLSEELKEKIISQGEILWDTVGGVEDLEDDIKIKLYKHKRVKVSWANVLTLYGLSDIAFVEYMKDPEVAKELKQVGKPNFEGDIRSAWEEMQTSILLSNSLTETILEIAACFDIEFNKPSLEQCDTKVLRLLVELDKVNKGVDEYNLLHVRDSKLGLIFFLKNYDVLVPELNDMDMDPEDFADIFREESEFSVKQRRYILSNSMHETLVSKYSANSIINLIISSGWTPISANEREKEIVKKSLYIAEADVVLRMRLFNIFRLSDKNEIDRMIATFEETYVENGQLKDQIPYSFEARVFCKYLKDIGYLKNSKCSEKKGFISIRRQ